MADPPLVIDAIDPIVTPITVEIFRRMFRAFRDVEDYPDMNVQLYVDLASRLLLPPVWRDQALLARCQGLFAAHFLVLDKRDENAAEAGGVPGNASGVVASKSVGSVSVSYDLASGMEMNAGHWNTTTYGRQFYRWVRLVGAGPAQVSGPQTLDRGFGAWPGVQSWLP